MGGAGEGNPGCFVGWVTCDLGFEDRIEISGGTGMWGWEYRHKPVIWIQLSQKECATGTRLPRDITGFQWTTCSGL